jgi:hypothetical protein
VSADLFHTPRRWWFALFHTLGNVIEQIRGPRVLREITERRAQIESLTGLSTAGFVTVIYCQERTYLCTYTRWWVYSRIITTYTVFSKVEGPAPAELVKACALERTFPALVNPFTGSFDKKRAAIEAYLDLVLVEAGVVRS